MYVCKGKRGREEDREGRTEREGCSQHHLTGERLIPDSRCWRIERLSQTHGGSDTERSSKLLRRRD